MSDNSGASEQRTEFAEDRTLLANERSFAAWLRTGLAATGVGIGFGALFQAMNPLWVPKAIATGVLVMAICIYVVGASRAARIAKKLEYHSFDSMGRIRIIGLMAGLITVNVALIAAIWLLRSPAG